MPSEYRILLLEDDLYSRDMMELLLRRDWRTQVVGGIDSIDQLKAILDQQFFDLILVDIESPEKLELSRRLIESVQGKKRIPGVLFVSTSTDPAMVKELSNPFFRGYLIKREIGYSLAWAVSLACSGNFVITPSIEQLLTDDPDLLKKSVVLKGQNELFGLTRQETEIARLGILFNLPRSNLAQELNRSPYTIYEYVHKAYEKLEVREIYDQGITPEEYFKHDQVFLKHFQDKLALLWTTTRTSKDLDTLAFHLLTIPEIL